jgi:group I intron endonuclease
MGFIYCISSPSNKVYIGQTIRNVPKRIKEHAKREGSCILLENAIQKYGLDCMKVEILLEVNNEMLDEYEMMFIDMYNSIEPNGYNIRSGGSCKSTHSELSGERMRIAKLGEKNHNFGKPRSDACKQAISDAKSGEKHHFYGKKITEDHKLKLAKSHRKSDDDLPMYMVYVKPRPEQYQAEGYAIVNHSTLKNKYFTSKKLSLDEKYNLAQTYLLTA